MDQWQGGRDSDSELTCFCSRTGVSNWPGDSYPAAERHASVLCEANRYWSSATTDVSNEQRYVFILAVGIPVKILDKYGRELCSRVRSNLHLGVCIIAVHTSCDSRTAIVFVSEGSERVKTATLSFKLNQVLSDS